MDSIHYEFTEEYSSNKKQLTSVPTWTIEETFLGVIPVVAVYLTLVLRVLPSYMRNRKPFYLKRILLFYNMFQVVFSFYAASVYARYILKYGFFTTQCPRGEELKKVANKIAIYFIAKHIDLLDTVFFLLRKKDSQVTFLHVYHHAVMVAWAWMYWMYHPTDQFVVVGLTNSAVHVIMYAYYALTCLGAEYAKYVWWKKHLTKIQLIQFVLVLYVLFAQQKYTPCPIPTAFHGFSIVTTGSFMILFLNFYWKSYVAKRKKCASVDLKYLSQKAIN